MAARRDTGTVLRWGALAAAVGEATLLISAAAGVDVPPWLVVAAALATVAVAASVLATVARRWRLARASGCGPRRACVVALDATLPPLAMTAMRLEGRMWLSLVFWVTRRRRGVGPHDRAFGFHKLVLPVMWGLVGVSVVELVLWELVIPWDAVRTVVLIVDVYGLVLAFGALAAVVVHPHVVSADALLVRTGFRYELSVPLSRVRAAHAVRASHKGKRIALEDGVLHVAVSGETTVRILLNEPMEVPLPRGHHGTATEVRIHADDARGLAGMLREAADGSAVRA